MTFRDARGRFLPGNHANPTGRPTTKVSMLRLLEEKLLDNATSQAIINALVDKCIKERDVPAIREIFDRIDGKVADTHKILGLFVHVGDEYAQLGLAAMRADLESRKVKYLPAPEQINGQLSEEVVDLSIQQSTNNTEDNPLLETIGRLRLKEGKR